MHKASRRMMRTMLHKYLADEPTKIVDVGSYDVNGTYKILMKEEWQYTGVDIEDGPNVDIHMPALYTIPVPDETFDVAISGQCFEHVANPFKLMCEVSRIVKPEGLFIMTAPFQAPEHRHPIDCWRIFSDGWKSLFEESNIDVLETFYNLDDSWAVGRKR